MVYRYCILILLSLRAWGAEPERHYADALARARSPAEVERLTDAYAALKIAQSACQIQLREHAAPVSCYEALALESDSKRETGADIEARRRHLDRLCARAAGDLRLSAPTKFVSAACAKSLASARAIQKYRDEEGAEWSGY